MRISSLFIKCIIRNFAGIFFRSKSPRKLPHVLHFDETQEFPHEIFKKLGELGFLGILVPTEYGGSGLGYQEYSVIVEEIAISTYF